MKTLFSDILAFLWQYEKATIEAWDKSCYVLDLKQLQKKYDSYEKPEPIPKQTDIPIYRDKTSTTGVTYKYGASNL